MSDFFKQLLEMNSPYLIAEIGINHGGSLEIALAMADATPAMAFAFTSLNPNCSSNRLLIWVSSLIF